MDGSGVRAMIVAPATNTTIGAEMTALCPELAPFGIACVVRGGGMFRARELAGYTQATLDALTPYRADPPDIVFQGCNAAGFLAGVHGHARMIGVIRDHIGCAVVSTAQSMADVLLAHSLTRISVLTPYIDSLNNGLRSYLNDCGIAVDALDGFRCTTTAELAAVTEAQVFDRAIATVAPASKGVFLACTQMPTLGVIPRLQARLGIPVWSAVSASAWNGARILADKRLH